MATIDDFGGEGQPLNNPALGGPNGWAAAVRDAIRLLQAGLPDVTFEAAGLPPGADPTIDITTVDGVTVVTIGIPDGAQGDPSPEPAFTWEVSTLAPGESATITVTGTYPDLNIALGLPQGATGGATLGGVLTAKGDLAVGQGAGVATRQPAGADGSVLSYDSSTATGLGAAKPGNLLTKNQATGTAALAATTGFTTYNATQASSTEQTYKANTRSLKVTSTGGSGASYITLGNAQLKPSTTYTLIAAVYSSTDRVQMNLAAVISSSIVTQGSLVATVTPNAWRLITLTITTPAAIDTAATAGYAYIYPDPRTVGSSVYVGGLSWHEGVGGRLTDIGVPVPDLGTVYGSGAAADCALAPIGCTYTDTTTGAQYTRVAAGWKITGTTPPRIILPADISAVVGDTLQVFRRGIVEANNPYAMPSKMESTVGKEFPRFWEYTPVAGDSGTTKTLTVTAQDTDQTALTTASVSVVVKTATNPASTKRIMCVGDSLTSAGVWTAEAYRRLTQSGGTPAGSGLSNFEFIGTDPLPGFGTQKVFGRGGWSWQAYTNASPITSARITATGHGKDLTDQKSVYLDSGGRPWFIETIEDSATLKVIASGHSTPLAASGTLTYSSGGTHTANITFTASTALPGTPFWSGSAFSIKSWCDTYSAGNGPDLLIAQLGWNAVTTATDAAGYASLVTAAKVFADKLHTEYPSAKMLLLGLQMPSLDGGLGTGYGATGVYGHAYDLMRQVNGVNLAYGAWAAETSYSPWLRYASVAAQFDSEYNMPATVAPVNSRSTTTERRGTNGIHPADSGYLQIADVAYREIVRALS